MGWNDRKICSNDIGYVFEVAFALPQTIEIHRAFDFEVEQSWIEIDTFLLDIPAQVKRSTTRKKFCPSSAASLKRLHPLCRRGLSGRDLESGQGILPTVRLVSYKSSHVIDHQFGLIGDR